VRAPARADDHEIGAVSQVQHRGRARPSCLTPEMVEQEHRSSLDLAAQPTTGKAVHAHVQIDERFDELEPERAGWREWWAGHRPREPTRRPSAQLRSALGTAR